MAQLKAVMVTYLDFTIIKTRNKISQNLNLGRQDGSTSKKVSGDYTQSPKPMWKDRMRNPIKLYWPPQASHSAYPLSSPPHTHNATQNLRWTQWQFITLVPERGKQEDKVQSQPELHSEISKPNHQLTKQLPTNQTKMSENCSLFFFSSFYL